MPIPPAAVHASVVSFLSSISILFLPENSGLAEAFLKYIFFASGNSLATHSRLPCLEPGSNEGAVKIYGLYSLIYFQSICPSGSIQGKFTQ